MAVTKRIETNKASPDFIKQLAGYGLATARILYHLPDHPRLLQTYIWQDYDLAPDFPILSNFWRSGGKSSTGRCIAWWWDIRS